MASSAPAGYSGTPLAKKLGIKAGARLLLLNAPAEMADWLAPLPPEVEALGPRAKNADVIVFFTKERKALVQRLPGLMAAMTPACGLWIAWPKKASKVPTDITEDVVRGLALEAGLVDNKVCAISEVWSGLRIVYRLKDRPK